MLELVLGITEAVLLVMACVIFILMACCMVNGVEYEIDEEDPDDLEEDGEEQDGMLLQIMDDGLMRELLDVQVELYESLKQIVEIQLAMDQKLEDFDLLHRQLADTLRRLETRLGCPEEGEEGGGGTDA